MLPSDHVPQDACQTSSVETPESGLPLPDPYPEYIRCPHCGEPEVEVWCYQARAQCHACGKWLEHTPPACFDAPGKCKVSAS